MANINITSDAWTEISVTSGTIQNISATADIELSAEQTDNSGVVLKPSELYQWDNETIYARAVTEDTGALRVVNFKRAAGGGGYVLPVASSSTLGGVKIGSSITIDNGVIYSDPVGRVVFDVVLRSGYIKANGATVADASTAVPDLLQFVQDNPSILAADAAAYAANVGLYLYDIDTGELTLPNYMARVMQGGNSVESVEAGLPNIQSELVCIRSTETSTSDLNTQNTALRWSLKNYDSNVMQSTTTSLNSYLNVNFDASRASSIYGGSSTVQSPAVKMIPQIKY